jgi:hypothetical protein
MTAIGVFDVAVAVGLLWLFLHAALFRRRRAESRDFSSAQIAKSFRERHSVKH